MNNTTLIITATIMSALFIIDKIKQNKQLDKGLTQEEINQEIIQARTQAKEQGIATYITKVLIEEWRTEPLLSTWNFSKGLIGMISIIYLLSCLNNDIRYCTITNNIGQTLQEDHFWKIIPEWNDYMNTKNMQQQFNPQLIQQNTKTQQLIKQEYGKLNHLSCTYKPRKWLKERTGI